MEDRDIQDGKAFWITPIPRNPRRMCVYGKTRKKGQKAIRRINEEKVTYCKRHLSGAFGKLDTQDEMPVTV